MPPGGAKQNARHDHAHRTDRGHAAQPSPAYAPTPLLDLPALARRLGVAQVLAKDEGQRMLGSFKSLGGTFAGLCALSRAAGVPVEALLDPARRPATPLPALICASDGNHGLAVAAAARRVGAARASTCMPGCRRRGEAHRR
ncbi:pyridoxal-phosphate dependent enzyme [Pseudoroseomonas wenyumeiae]